jgi:hypothetical protein
VLGNNTAEIVLRNIISAKDREPEMGLDVLYLYYNHPEARQEIETVFNLLASSAFCEWVNTALRVVDPTAKEDAAPLEDKVCCLIFSEEHPNCFSDEQLSFDYDTSLLKLLAPKEGAGQALLLVWQKSQYQREVEQMFYLLTSRTFLDYVNDIIEEIEEMEE